MNSDGSTSQGSTVTWAPPEDVYGHRKRLEWLRDHLARDQHVVELGCGTGVMITMPLRRAGFDVVGVDLDEASIEFGRDHFRSEGLDPESLMVRDVRDFDVRPDVVIASEVLEHLVDGDLAQTLDAIRTSLPIGRELLVTVPNGYGWFELESALWFKLGLGRLLERLKVDRIVRRVKGRFVELRTHDEPPSTLADSPHVQRFTPASLREILGHHGFEVRSFDGTVLFSGPFTNLIFEDVQPFLRLNRFAGGRLPRAASGWLISAVRVS